MDKKDRISVDLETDSREAVEPEPETEAQEVAEKDHQDPGTPPGDEPEAFSRAKEEAEFYKDRWMRLAAEFDNFKKRTSREIGALIQSANEDLIRDLLPILDSVDRALLHQNDGKGDSEAFREGVQMIMEQLPRTLRNRNLQEIDPVGQLFDPHFHEALMQAPSDQYDAGLVSVVMEKGYCLGDRVLRPAKVVVSQGPPEEDSSRENGKE